MLFATVYADAPIFDANTTNFCGGAIKIAATKQPAADVMYVYVSDHNAPFNPSTVELTQLIYPSSLPVPVPNTVGDYNLAGMATNDYFWSSYLGGQMWPTDNNTFFFIDTPNTFLYPYGSRLYYSFVQYHVFNVDVANPNNPMGYNTFRHFQYVNSSAPIHSQPTSQSCNLRIACVDSNKIFVKWDTNLGETALQLNAYFNSQYDDGSSNIPGEIFSESVSSYYLQFNTYRVLVNNTHQSGFKFRGLTPCVGFCVEAGLRLTLTFPLYPEYPHFANHNIGIDHMSLPDSFFHTLAPNSGADCNVTANAGPDKNTGINTPVQLDGNAIGGLPPYTYSWSLLFPDPTCSFDNNSILSPAINCTTLGVRTIRFRLNDASMPKEIVFDDVNVNIYSVNLPLVADAGPDKNTQINLPVTLTGNASGGIPNYNYYWEWLVNPGNTCSFNNANLRTPDVNCSSVGVKTAKLTVTDSNNNIAYDNVDINVSQSFPQICSDDFLSITGDYEPVFGSVISFSYYCNILGGASTDANIIVDQGDNSDIVFDLNGVRACDAVTKTFDFNTASWIDMGGLSSKGIEVIFKPNNSACSAAQLFFSIRQSGVPPLHFTCDIKSFLAESEGNNVLANYTCVENNTDGNLFILDLNGSVVCEKLNLACGTEQNSFKGCGNLNSEVYKARLIAGNCIKETYFSMPKKAQVSIVPDYSPLSIILVLAAALFLIYKPKMRKMNN